METVIIIAIVAAVLLLLIIFFAAGYTKAGPDEAIMISGRGKKKILIGKIGVENLAWKSIDFQPF